MGFHLHPTSEVNYGNMYTQKTIFPIASLILACLFVLPGNEPLASEEEFQFKCVRAMGMGNAFAAIADDGDAFYYNPAGLATIRDIRLDIQPVRFIPSYDLYDQLKDLEQLRDDINALDESENPLEDPNLEAERRRLMDRMKRLLNDDLGIDVGFPVRVILPLHIGDCGVAIGGMTHAWSASRLEAQRRGLDWSDFVMDALDDEVYYHAMVETSYGVGAAAEIPLARSMELSFGVVARRIHRWRMTDADDLLGLDDILADDFQERYFDPEDPWASVSEGKGYSVDAGTIGSFGDAVNLAVVVQNLMGSVKYEGEADEELSQNIAVSGAVNLAKLSNPAVPMLDVILAARVDSDKETQLGLELAWNLPLLSLSGRIGSNRGYMTLGAGIKLLFLDFDYALYGDQNTNWHAFSLNLAF